MNSEEQHWQEFVEAPDRRSRPDLYYTAIQDLLTEWHTASEERLPGQGQSYEAEHMTEAERQAHEHKRHNRFRAAWVTEVMECADEVNLLFVRDPATRRMIEEKVRALHDHARKQNFEQQHMTEEDVRAGEELLGILKQVLEPLLPPAVQEHSV